MAKVELEILDNIIVKVKSGVKQFKGCLAYSVVGGYQGQYAWKRKDYNKYLIRRRKVGAESAMTYFYTGFLPRVINYCKKKGIEPIIKGQVETFPSKREPGLPGIDFWPIQNRLIRSALDGGRGTIVSPTGSGKTILAMGILSAYPNSRVLYLCPNLTIMKQTISELKLKGFNDVCSLGEGKKEITGRIAVSTVQTYRMLDLVELSDVWDVVIVDEIHLMTKSLATLEKILGNVLAPVRIGFTAKLPSEPERRLIIEGLLGPPLDILSIEEARKLKILSDVELRLIRVPVNKEISQIKTYSGTYKEGVVLNKARNRLVAREAKKMVLEENRSVVIFVSQIEHIGEISKTLGEVNLPYISVYGNTGGDERETVRGQMERKEVMCVISTIVWREGVNIKSLGGVILAQGGKTEDGLIQYVGRSLRRTETKDLAIVVDFLDPYRYLAEHCIVRLGVYQEYGWLK